ncbi:MAG: AMP-binding protein [Litoreibacter sp.]|uniref:AMP-binding protein n=1 Tax=Litoreibacter sp. TaxID=1969459 RepID=UPI003299D787
MFILNDQLVDLTPLDEMAFPDPQPHRYGLHLQKTDNVLRHIVGLRDADAGVFPIHPDIPAEKARKMALQAGCDRFVDEDGVTEIAQTSANLDGVLVQMSSGTTGVPKVTTRTWANVQTEVTSYVRFFTQAAPMTPVIACPITHSYGLIAGLMVAMERGHVPVVIDTLNPKYILRRMREVRDPLLYTSPAMLHMLASFLPAEQQLNAAMTSGTILSRHWFEQIRLKTKHLFQQYGCSEVGCIAINPELRDPRDVGYPLPHLQLTGGQSAGQPAPINVTIGGQQNETGDLGFLRPDGMLVFVSRQDDVIDVAGLNVYPHDIEQAALAMDGITDALAFRMQDDLAGDRAGLIFEGVGVAPDALQAWLADRLAPYQQPMAIHQVPQLPRQANGKINRRDVARQFFQSEMPA